MKNSLYLLIIGLIVVFTTSCEKVIDIDLKNADRKYVIEGVLTDQPNSCKVIISQTKAFDENNDFAGVKGAEVLITDESGVTVALTETAEGVYETNLVTGIPGNTYNLKVTINGEIFTASSTIPTPVVMDSLFIRDNTFFNEKIRLANVQFQDPEGKANYYRFVQYINGVKDKTIFVRDDDLFDGRLIDAQLFSRTDDEDDDQNKIESGDEVRVEMFCIDAKVYKYWYSLDQSARGESESASPANPVSNISGGALGYFSAHTYETKTIEAP